MASRTIIVPSASAVVLLAIFAITSTMRSCGIAPQQHESASVQSGGIIKDYVPQPATKPEEARPAPRETAPAKN